MPRARSTAGESVVVSVNVGPDGAVVELAILATPDPALARCIERGIRAVSFPPTQRGGSFRYPFVLS